MFEYQIWLEDSERGWYKRSVIAATPYKAKSSYYQDYKECWSDLTFKEFSKKIKCKKIGVANHECMFTDKENFERMTKDRGIQFAYQGMRVEVAGEMGTIIGNYGMNLLVAMDGIWRGENCHPWWKTRYFDKEGNVIWDYRELKDV
jgi:hypothetical protein